MIFILHNKFLFWIFCAGMFRRIWWRERWRISIVIKLICIIRWIALWRLLLIIRLTILNWIIITFLLTILITYLIWTWFDWLQFWWCNLIIMVKLIDIRWWNLVGILCKIFLYHYRPIHDFYILYYLTFYSLLLLTLFIWLFIKYLCKINLHLSIL